MNRDTHVAAYLRLFGWFALGIAATGAYVYLALLNVALLAVWPLLVLIGLSIFKCWTVADRPARWSWAELSFRWRWRKHPEVVKTINPQSGPPATVERLRRSVLSGKWDSDV